MNEKFPPRIWANEWGRYSRSPQAFEPEYAKVNIREEWWKLFTEHVEALVAEGCTNFQFEEVIEAAQRGIRITYDRPGEGKT